MHADPVEIIDEYSLEDQLRAQFHDYLNEVMKVGSILLVKTSSSDHDPLIVQAFRYSLYEECKLLSKHVRLVI